MVAEYYYIYIIKNIYIYITLKMDMFTNTNGNLMGYAGIHSTIAVFSAHTPILRCKQNLSTSCR
jgi:hypothetical protein